MTEYARTGCTLLDLLYGGDRSHLGIAYGTLVNFIGDTSSGKSMCGNEIIAAEFHRRKNNFVWQYEDGEEGNSFDTTALYGVDIRGKNLIANIPKKKYPKTPKTVEQMDARLSLFVDNMPKDAFGIYFMDSLDALSSEEMEERSKDRAEKYKKSSTTDDKGTYGMSSAKFLSQEFFRIQAGKIADKKVICGIVSQVRENVGAGTYGAKLRDSGGKAKGHWVSVKSWFKPKCDLFMPDSKFAYGQLIEVSIKKSRNGKIKRTCRFVFDTAYGIDDVKSNLDFVFNLRASDSGKLKKASDKIDWADKLKPTLKKKYAAELQETYGYEKLHKYIRSNKEMTDALVDMTYDAWDEQEKKASSGVSGKYS